MSNYSSGGIVLLPMGLPSPFLHVHVCTRLYAWHRGDFLYVMLLCGGFASCGVGS